MHRPIPHEDLVARALGALPPEERDQVDRALAGDAQARRRFEEVAGHLLQYDHMPPAPPPPPVERIAAALDREALEGGAGPDLPSLALQAPRRAPRSDGRWKLALAAAAAVLVGLLAWRPWDVTPQARLALVPGRGLAVMRDGRALPAPAQAARDVRAGDVLHSDTMAEGRLDDRVRFVLDGGSEVRVEGPRALTLLRGRAWFEVQRRDETAASAWEVRTAYGAVRVLGTVFEVDVRTGDLEVGVAQGLVQAAGHRVAAGERLAGGRVSIPRFAAGAWLDRPRLVLEADPQVLGTPLRLRLRFENPGQVPLVLRGPGSTRAPLWIGLEDPQGRILHEVRAERVLTGEALLRPGSRTTLAPGGREIVTLEIAAPLTSAGTYFCRALYRPEGQPGVLTDAIPIEVRRP